MHRCILTPNAIEFDRLFEAATVGLEVKNLPVEEKVHELSKLLGGVTIIRKGLSSSLLLLYL
jgi:NAD(P)H-hydrate repair Nnr-like enzyme with NAD(P)H-hydrate dehydratase domain